MEVVESRDGMKFFQRPGDVYHKKDTLVDLNLFEVDQLCTSRYFEDVGTGTIVDVGACHGESIIPMIWRNRFVKGIAIEPVKENFDTLLMNLENNRIKPRVAVHNVAIWHQPTEIRRNVRNPGGATIRDCYGPDFKVGSRGLIESPRVMKLSEIIENPVDLIWIDCQGAEERILLEDGNRLTQLCRYFYIEVHKNIDQDRFTRVVMRLFNWFVNFGSITEKIGSRAPKSSISSFEAIYPRKAKYQWVLFGRD